MLVSRTMARLSLKSYLVAILLLGGFWGCGRSETQKQAVAGGSILKNGNFEGQSVFISTCSQVQGRLPFPWSDNSCWNSASNVVYAVDGSRSKSGEAVKIVLRSGLFQLVQRVDLPVDWAFEVGIWLRSDTPMLVKIALRQSGPPYQEYGARYLRTGSNWTRLSVAAFSHGLTDAEARKALFVVSSATPGILWVDDASLTGAFSDLVVTSSEVPKQFFGTHAMHQENIKSAFTVMAAGSVRIWDSGGSQWRDVQPNRPSAGKRPYSWRMLDERVMVADDRKADMLMVLGGYAPDWASTDESYFAEPKHSGACNRCDESPRRMDDWRAWVGDLVGRYAGRSIKYWEIWNEPYFDSSHEWCPDQSTCSTGLASGYRGSPEQLLQLQTEAVQVIKRADPSAKVVSAGVSYLHRDYLDYFLKLGGGANVDVIGYHLYIDGPPELLMSHVLGVRALMRDHGVGDKPIWSTETAISQITPALDLAVRSASLSGHRAPSVEELAPAYLVRAFVVGWASGLSRIYQYAWDDQHQWPSTPGEVRRGTNLVFAANEMGVTYRQLAQWMPGKRLMRLDRGAEGGIWKAVFQDKSGKPFYIAWHPGKAGGDTAAMKLPDGITQQCDLQGRCASLKGENTLAIDFHPVYLLP